MSIPLILERGQLDDLKQNAEEHRISLAEIREIVDGKAPVIGDRPGYKKEIITTASDGQKISFGWTVAYSIEEHPLKQPLENGTATIWIRHMSMAQAFPGRYPSQEALALVAEELGFPPINECMVNEDPGTEAIAVFAPYP